MLSPIYAITDPHLLPGQALFAGVEQALAGGIRLVQYRDKSAADDSLVSNAQQLNNLCKQFSANLIINDRPDIAEQVGAAGVHLGQGDGDVTSARKLLGPNAIIGVTCHSSLELALQAKKDGANYVAFGRFFVSSTKPTAPPAPMSLLAQARSTVNLPIVAIGGITQDNMAQIFTHGAHCVAICHALFAAENIYECAQKLCTDYQINLLNSAT